MLAEPLWSFCLLAHLSKLHQVLVWISYLLYNDFCLHQSVNEPCYPKMVHLKRQLCVCAVSQSVFFKDTSVTPSLSAMTYAFHKRHFYDLWICSFMHLGQLHKLYVWLTPISCHANWCCSKNFPKNPWVNKPFGCQRCFYHDQSVISPSPTYTLPWAFKLRVRLWMPTLASSHLFSTSRTTWANGEPRSMAWSPASPSERGWGSGRLSCKSKKHTRGLPVVAAS